MFGSIVSTHIMNLYNLNESITKDEFQFYFIQLNTSHFITGVFNAHHHLWDDGQNSNLTGKNLVELFIELEYLVFLTQKTFSLFSMCKITLTGHQ